MQNYRNKLIYFNDILNTIIYKIDNGFYICTMNIQQLQYVLAVEELRHFEKAANKCFISQSTLSTMIARLENEINIQIFDRKTKPVSITKEGEILILQIKVILKEIESFNNQVQELKGEMIGDLRIGIIPTVAPYLLPLFLTEFATLYPNIKIIVQEMTTSNILDALKKRELDVGLLALPINDNDLHEIPLYNEPFLLFDCLEKRQQSTIENIDYTRLLLLEEGHCLRNQVEQICNLSNKSAHTINFEFRAGSIDSLIRFTKSTKGLTLLPYLATIEMNETDKTYLQPFTSNVPMRSIGLLTHKHFVKKQLLRKLKMIITRNVNISKVNGKIYTPFKN